MINDTYQMISELKCDDLYVIRKGEHMKGKTVRSLLEKKCGFEV
tara:strand:- start:341 stop:472 length:132 start_codon:yes stop_codon:yes gene_type:complete